VIRAREIRASLHGRRVTAPRGARLRRRRDHVRAEHGGSTREVRRRAHTGSRLKAGAAMPMMVATKPTREPRGGDKAVVDAVRGGELTEERLDQSVPPSRDRAQGPARAIQGPARQRAEGGREAGTRGHLAAAARVGDHSVTLVKNDAGLVPMTPGAGQKVLVTGYRLRLRHPRRAARRPSRHRSPSARRGDRPVRDRHGRGRRNHRLRREQGLCE
jgi:beta-glucosidase-like glycosyl hydrolase